MDSCGAFKEILKNNSNYSFTPLSIEQKFTYQSSEHRLLKKLKKKYKLEELAGHGNEFKQMSNLMAWVSDTLKYSTDTESRIDKYNALNILKQTYKKNIAANCWMFAVVLNELYLSMGFKSRMIRCMSADLKDTECHCVTIVYSNEYNKWVMFDAANKAYFINKKAQPMSLEELREAFINDEEFILPRASKEDFEKIKNYWYKNLVRFQCYSHSAFNFESTKEEKTIYNLNPSSIRVENKVEIVKGVKFNYINLSNPKIFWKD